MTEIQELLQGYNNLADELKERTKRLEELEHEMENTEKPNLQQVSKAYSHQCDLVLQSFRDKIVSKIERTLDREKCDKVVGIIDNTLKEFLK